MRALCGKTTILGGILMKFCQELGDNLKEEVIFYFQRMLLANAQPVHNRCIEAIHSSHKGVRQSKGLGNPRTLDPRRGMDLPPWIVENKNHYHHHLDRQTRACSSSTTSPGLIFLLAKTTRPTPSILNSMKTLFATSWRWGEIGRGWWLWTWKRQMVDRLKLDDGLLCEYHRHTPGWVGLAYLAFQWPWVVLFLFAVIIILSFDKQDFVGGFRFYNLTCMAWVKHRMLMRRSSWLDDDDNDDNADQIDTGYDDDEILEK